MRWLIVLLAPLLLAATCAESGSSNNPPVSSGGAAQQAVPTSAVAPPLQQVGAPPPVVGAGIDDPLPGDNLLCSQAAVGRLKTRPKIEARAVYQVCTTYGGWVLEWGDVQSYVQDDYNARVRVVFTKKGCSGCPIETYVVVAFQRDGSGDWDWGTIADTGPTAVQINNTAATADASNRPRIPTVQVQVLVSRVEVELSGGVTLPMRVNPQNNDTRLMLQVLFFDGTEGTYESSVWDCCDEVVHFFSYKHDYSTYADTTVTAVYYAVKVGDSAGDWVPIR